MRVVVGVLEQDGKILINQRKQDGLLAGFWEFPGGKVEDGENDSEALVREFFEEFGLQIVCNDLIEQEIFDYGSHKVDLRFYGCALTVDSLPVANEGHEWCFVTYGELKNYEFLPGNAKLLEKLITI